MSDYPAPVAKLLELGEQPLRQREWPNYLGMGLGREHIPDLIRLVKTWIPEAEDEDEEIDWDIAPPWAPVHAWQALGQLRAGEATETLFEILRRERETDCSDWASCGMAFVFGKIGAGALPVLSATLKNTEIDDHLRWCAADGIEQIGMHHPETRDECVALLSAQLEKASEQESDFNAGLVAGLAELKAVEAAGVIERAFEARKVDQWVVGTWEEIRHELGLGPPPAPRRSLIQQAVTPPGPILAGGPIQPPITRAQDRAPNRKKMAKKSKKKNRKKKK